MSCPSLIIALNRSIRQADAYWRGVTPVTSLNTRCRCEGLIPIAWPNSERVGAEPDRSNRSEHSCIYLQTRRTRPAPGESWSGRQRLQALNPAASASTARGKKATRWGEGRRLGRVDRGQQLAAADATRVPQYLGRFYPVLAFKVGVSEVPVPQNGSGTCWNINEGR